MFWCGQKSQGKGFAVSTKSEGDGASARRKRSQIFTCCSLSHSDRFLYISSPYHKFAIADK
ncbi:MAG: hypothetical protein KME50_22510 [Nostoc desertorum CM1-VF14]|nr:hypothetical protein [Nostoc desertorum CM1-VF14]